MGNVNAKDKNGDTLLINACKKSDEKMVKALIEHKADINMKNNKNGYTPLIIACNEGNESIVKILVEHGAKVNLKDENGYTALIFACSNGNISLVEYLIEQGADVNTKDENGDTPLIITTIFGNKTIVKYLIDHGANVNMKNDKKGYSPLMIACSNYENDSVNKADNVVIVKNLVDSGADVNMINEKSGDTSLIIACKVGDDTIVKYLIERGAKINVKNEKSNVTPLVMACHKGSEGIVKYLVEHGAKINLKTEHGDTPLIVACKKKDEKIAKYLMNHKADVNMENKDGDTPLIIACKKEDKEIVKQLVSHKANVNIKNRNADTPLAIACANGNEIIVKYLIDHGANVNVENKNGYTPLTRACYKENEKIIKYLVEHGATINNNKLDEPLSVVIRYGNESLTKYLIDHKADVNKENTNGYTPLIDACYKGNEVIVKYLIDHKADTNKKSKNGDTPLSVACMAGNCFAIIKYLVDHGADVNEKGKNGDTPLIIACNEGHLNSAKTYIRSTLTTKLNEVEKGKNKPTKKDEPQNIEPVPTSDEINKPENKKNDISGSGQPQKWEDRDEIIKYLIDHGADVNAKSKDGETPLIITCKRQNGCIVKYLIDNGADMNIKNAKGEKPLTIAYKLRNGTIIKYLMEKTIKYLGNIKDDRERKITEKMIETFLMDYPSQIGMSIDNSKDIFEEFINQRCFGLITLLIRKGREVNNYMKNGKLPIELAIENDDIEMIKALIHLGANVEVRTQNGIKIIDLIRDSMPEYYKTESMVDRNTSVEEIIDTKDEDMVKIIIEEEGLNIDTEDSYGVNLLQKSIIQNDAEKLNELVRLGADVNKADGIVQVLLKQNLQNDMYGLEMKEFSASSSSKADEKTISDLELRNYNSIASEYIISNEFSEANKLIHKYHDILKWQNNDELNLISQMIIMLQDQQEINSLEEIIDRYPYVIDNEKYAINQVNHSTPLHYLVEKLNKSPEAIELLDRILPKVKDVKILDVENTNGMTALDYAIAINNIDAVKKLYEKNMELKKDSIERKENIIHMQYALLNDDISTEKLKTMILEVVKIRNEKEKDITFENIINDNTISHGQSLLHIASYFGKKDIVNYLLKQEEIKLDVKDRKGRTPIFYAILAQEEEIVKALINKDKNKNILMETDDFNAAPLNYAIITQNEEITSLLIPKTKDLSIHDKNGRSFLHYAVASQNLNIIGPIFREISNYGEKILNIQDTEGKSALHYAAMSRNKDILNLFLTSDKIDYEIIDKNELKAIDYLLMGKLETTEIQDENNYNTLPGIIRKMIIKTKDNDKEMCKRNVLHSACQNKISPDEAIKIVLGEKRRKIPELIHVPLSSHTGKKPLDIALENPKISSPILVELIKAAGILESEEEERELLNKLLIYNREDIAVELGIDEAYYERVKELPGELYRLIKKQKDLSIIKSTLGISSTVNCKHFKLYDYAIVKDRYDWFEEFIRHETSVDMEKVKDRVVEYNAINILEHLMIKGEDFIRKSLWKKASDDIRATLLQYYKEHHLLEEEVVKAAKVLNVSFVSKVLKIYGIYVKGLLHIAVEKSSRDLARVVIEQYRDTAFKERDENSNTAMDKAIKAENIEMITYLIMKGAPVMELKGDSLTPIKNLINEEVTKAKERYSIISGGLDAFKKKLKSMTKSEINEKDYLGNTLLFYAIENNNVEMVSKLIKSGASTNLKNNYKETPLFLSIKYADSQMVKEIMSSDCSNVFEMYYGKSLLHYALKRVVVTKKAKEVDERESETKDSIALKLLERGVYDLSPSTINDKIRYDRIFNKEYLTQLMYFILKEDKSTAEKLIKAPGINLHQTDNDGITAYGYALHKRYTDLMYMIENQEPNINRTEKNEKDFFGLTDRKTAMIATTGIVAAGLGILAKQTNAGGMAYDLIENVVIENSKRFLSEDTKETLEKVQKERTMIQENAQRIIDSKAVKDAYTYIKNRKSKDDKKKEKKEEKEEKEKK